MFSIMKKLLKKTLIFLLFIGLISCSSEEVEPLFEKPFRTIEISDSTSFMDTSSLTRGRFIISGQCDQLPRRSLQINRGYIPLMQPGDSLKATTKAP